MVTQICWYHWYCGPLLDMMDLGVPSTRISLKVWPNFCCRDVIEIALVHRHERVFSVSTVLSTLFCIIQSCTCSYGPYMLVLLVSFCVYLAQVYFPYYIMNGNIFGMGLQDLGTVWAHITSYISLNESQLRDMTRESTMIWWWQLYFLLEGTTLKLHKYRSDRYKSSDRADFWQRQPLRCDSFSVGLQHVASYWDPILFYGSCSPNPICSNDKVCQSCLGGREALLY